MRAGIALVFAGLLLLAAAFQACGGESETLPQAITLAAAPPFAESALEAANQFAAEHGITVQAAADPAQADITIGLTEPAQGFPFVWRYWAPAVQLSHPAQGITFAELADAFAGRLTDWSLITGSGAPIRPLLPAQPAPPVEQWWPGRRTVGETLPLEEIPGALEADPNALALLPLDAVNAGVKTLPVGGISLVFGTGDPGSYPLIERAWVSRRAVEGKKLGEVLDQLVAALAQHLAKSPPRPMLLRATGDIIPARCAYARQLALGDLGHAFRELGPWLAEAGITVGSLDAAISDAGVPFDCVETFSLLAPAASVEGLAYAGFDVITVATNHVKDCGQAACGDQAFFDTLANLRANHIEPVGGGADLAEARRPAVIDVGGVSFAFLGYDEIAPYYHAEPGVPGTAPLNEAFLREDIAAAKASADVVVVLPQWGLEYQAVPTEGQRALARAAVEEGADLVIGNHPHWVEAVEMIDGTFVAYALGNFVFDQDWSLETQQGVVLEAAFDGAALKGVRFYPIHIFDQHQPRFAEPEEAQQIMDRIWTASAALQ